MSKLQITFLGTSASVPTPARGMPAIALKWQGKIYLFDCGEGTQRRMMQEKIGYGSLEAVFLSHLHLDHTLGMHGLIETLNLLQPVPRPIEVFAPKGLSPMNKRAFVTLHTIKPRGGLLFQKNDCTIRAVRVKHGDGDARYAYGFIFEEHERRKFDEKKAHEAGLRGQLFTEIQKKGSLAVNGKTIHLDDISWVQKGLKVVYSGDCAPSEALRIAAEGADILIHESTFSSDKAAEAKERNHSTAADAAQLAKDAGVKQLILTHISPRYSDEEKLKSLHTEATTIFPNTVVAHDGFVANL